MAGELTEAQAHTLDWLNTARLPPSWQGFPGIPAGCLDMRSIAALERRGLVESVAHKHRVHGEVKDRFVLTYRSTDAGRALTQSRNDGVSETKGPRG
jgi:hypothetical protein